MSTKIKKTYCTVFKRTDGEKKQAAMAAELEETKREVSELKELINRLMIEKELESGVVSSPKKSTKSKSTKSTKSDK